MFLSSLLNVVPNLLFLCFPCSPLFPLPHLFGPSPQVGLLDGLALPPDSDGVGSDGGRRDPTVLHVTCTPRGWFANASATRLPLSPASSSVSSASAASAVFDPRPLLVLSPPSSSSSSASGGGGAASYLAAPELHGLLCQASPLFADRWRRALEVRKAMHTPTRTAHNAQRTRKRTASSSTDVDTNRA